MFTFWIYDYNEQFEPRSQLVELVWYLLQIFSSYIWNQFHKYIFKNSQSGNALAINIWAKFFIFFELTPVGMYVTLCERGVWIFPEPHFV